MRFEYTAKSTACSMFAAVLMAGAACHPQIASTTTSTMEPPRVANLHAFARLYGVLRWFHPSDAAAVIDWDRFAIDGVRRIIGVPDAQTRRAVLGELIAPFAPTVHIGSAGEPFPDEPALHPASIEGLEVVAWEHEGFGDSILVSAYATKRRHRPRTTPVEGAPFAALWQSLDATAYRGMRVRLRGHLRTAGHAQGQLWLRVDRGDAVGFFDNMDDHPVVGASWAAAEVIGTVDADATRIVFGPLMSGGGIAWYDDVELAMQAPGGAWTPIAIRDPGFESSEPTAGWSRGNGRPGRESLAGWNVTLDHDRPASGTAALRLEQATQVTSDELFADAPRPGETIDVDLGAGLRARVPLALYSKGERTIGDDPEAARRSQPAVSPQAGGAGFDAAAGIADVIVLWNVLQHFWPYWDLISSDWSAELDTALRDALDDRTTDEHTSTLRRLAAAAPDAHASTSCPGESMRAYPRFIAELIEGKVVVTASGDSTVMRGDIVVSVDGRSASDELAAASSLISGAPQWKVARACRELGVGPIGSTLKIGLVRNGVNIEASVRRGDWMPAQYSHPAIERLEDGVYYVDLDRASMADIDAMMDRLAAAPGVVFDLRGYPNGNHKLLSHLLTRPDDSKAWLSVPRVIRPDHTPSSITSWNSQGWEMPVLEPHISGRVAFLTGPRAASYAESVMGLVEHYHLGEIVGSATAGTNGNVIEVGEPTGCRTRLTGMRVTKHDGSQHHLVGVLPTIPAPRTIAGVTAGRDEVLEKALVYVRTGAR